MKKLIQLIIILFSFNSLSAQIIAGSEIYYKRTSNRTYKITAVVYRACNSSPLTNLDGWVMNGSNKQNLPFTRTSITKINDTCGQPCQYVNDYSNPGFEKHIYETNLDLNNNAYTVFLKQCQIQVAIFQSGRDGNLSTQNTGKYYNEASINICDSTISNHSPIFSMEPKFHMSLNNPLSYSPGPQDTTDYDSLAFSIEPVLVDYNTSIQYKTSFSYQVPLTPYCPPNPGVTNCRALPNAKPPRGFYFDPSLCTIIFTPTALNEKGYVRIKIREFRKLNNQWVELGSVSRDFRVETFVTPDNNLPYFVNNSNLKSPIKFCGDELNFKLTAEDDPFLPKQTIPDSTTIIYDYGHKTSEFKTSKGLREMVADFKFNFDSANILKSHYFTIGAYDKQCNISLITQTYNVNLLQKADYIKSYTLDSCHILKASFKLKDTTLLGSASYYVLGNYVTPLTPNTFQLNGDGNYTLYTNATIGNKYCNINTVDTIKVINSFPKPLLSQQNDTSVCSSAPIQLSFSPFKLPNIASWVWYKNDTLINTTDSVIYDKQYTYSNFKLIVTNNKSCKSYSVVKYKYINHNYNVFAGYDIAKCPFDSITVYASNPLAKAPAKYLWTYNNTSYTTNSYQLKLALNYPDTRAYLHVRIDDDNHCITQDSMMITTFQSPKFDVITNKPQICEGEPYSLKIGNIKNTKVKDVFWKTKTGIGQYNNKDSISFPYASANTFFVTLIDSNNCYDFDTFELKPIANPKVVLTPLKDICTGDKLMANVKITYPDKPSIYWYFNNQLIKHQDTFLQFTPSSSGKIKFVVGNDNYCFASDSDNFFMVNYPKVKIIGDSVFNYNDYVTLTCQSDYSNYLWKYNKNTKDFKVLASSIGTPGYYQIWARSYNNLGCLTYDTVTIHIKDFTSVNNLNKLGIQVYPNPSKDVLNIESKEAYIIELIDVNGRLIQTLQLNSGNNVVDVSKLESGLYYIRIGGYVSTFVKE